MTDAVTAIGIKSSFHHVYVRLTENDMPKPRLTFCYIYNAEKTYVGVSICTSVHIKSTDERNMAYKRAKKALFSRVSSEFIAKPEAVEILNHAAEHLLFVPAYKSMVIPIPNFRFVMKENYLRED